LLAVEESVEAGIPGDIPDAPLGDEPVVVPDPVVPGDAAIPEVVEPVVLLVVGDGVGAGLGVGATAGVFDVVTGGVVSRLSQADKPSTNPTLQTTIVNVRMNESPCWDNRCNRRQLSRLQLRLQQGSDGVCDNRCNRRQLSSFDAIAMHALISMEIHMLRVHPQPQNLWKNYRWGLLLQAFLRVAIQRHMRLFATRQRRDLPRSVR